MNQMSANRANGNVNDLKEDIGQELKDIMPKMSKLDEREVLKQRVKCITKELAVEKRKTANYEKREKKKRERKERKERERKERDKKKVNKKKVDEKKVDKKGKVKGDESHRKKYTRSNIVIIDEQKLSEEPYKTMYDDIVDLADKRKGDPKATIRQQDFRNTKRQGVYQSTKRLLDKKFCKGKHYWYFGGKNFRFMRFEEQEMKIESKENQEENQEDQESQEKPSGAPPPSKKQKKDKEIDIK